MLQLLLFVLACSIYGLDEVLITWLDSCDWRHVFRLSIHLSIYPYACAIRMSVISQEDV